MRPNSSPAQSGNGTTKRWPGCSCIDSPGRAGTVQPFCGEPQREQLRRRIFRGRCCCQRIQLQRRCSVRRNHHQQQHGDQRACAGPPGIPPASRSAPRAGARQLKDLRGPSVAPFARRPPPACALSQTALHIRCPQLPGKACRCHGCSQPSPPCSPSPRPSPRRTWRSRIRRHCVTRRTPTRSPRTTTTCRRCRRRGATIRARATTRIWARPAASRSRRTVPAEPTRSGAWLRHCM